MTETRREIAAREATVIQRRAADPRRSLCLRASAGSGKTKVLVDRIVRLLLDRSPLKSIVALTFTRKAAVEIRDRLNGRVGALARMDPAELTAALTDLLDRQPSADEADRAARLYEEALEDASGLLIGTIHTFCTTLLRRFADEAGVDPAFAVVEDVDDLWDEALGQLEAEIAADAEDRAEYSRLAADPVAARLLLRRFEAVRLELDRWCDRLAGAAGRPVDAPLAALHPLLAADLAAHLFADTPLAGAGHPTAERLREPLAAAARTYAGEGAASILATQDGADTRKLAAELAERAGTLLSAADALDAGDDVETVLAMIATTLFTAEGGDRKLRSGTTKEPWKSDRNAANADAVRPVQALLRLRELIVLHERNIRLLRFGLRALDRFDELKARDRCLDFHDLERLSWRLVREKDVRAWVLFRLDAGLDHLLIDEFQDTNLNQWELLEPFIQEFTGGRAEDGRARTAFFVGDVKQSIYRFRGARPTLFGDVEKALTAATGDETLTLPANFRSLPGVVDGVGDAFQAVPLRDRLPGPEEIQAARQIPFRDEAQGLLLVPEPAPTDESGVAHAETAQRTVRAVRHLLDTKQVFEHGLWRPARCGDVLVLARTRTHLEAYEKAFRTAALPIVPAGRGALARSREVQDVLLLLRWLVFPADDAALAGVLRSPLFRITERELQSLLALRRDLGGGRRDAWTALRSDQAPPGLAFAAARLEDWRGRAGNESIHRLLRRIYRETRAPERFAAALGEQARWNLLRLHDLALTHAGSVHPSLRGFIGEIERAALRADQEEAVLPDASGGRIRLMTIHGAKGLEAPFVLLVDAADPMGRRPERLVLDEPHGAAGPLLQDLTRRRLGDEHDDDPLAVAAARAMDAVRSEQANLLYVALTRARDEVIVLGAAPTRGLDEPSFADWLRQARNGWDPTPDWLTDDAAAPPDSDVPVDETDAVRSWRPTGLRPTVETVKPSSLAPPSTGEPGDRDDANGPPAPTADRDAALAHGTAVHRWLQAAAETGTPPAGAGRAREEAAAVFANPELDPVFRPDTGEAYCEAPVVAHLDDRRRLLGTIDRLLLLPDATWVVDYKTNQVPGGDPAGLVAHYRPQMEAYREALRRLRPTLPVRCFLLFTQLEGDRGPGRLIEIPETV